MVIALCLASTEWAFAAEDGSFMATSAGDSVNDLCEPVTNGSSRVMCMEAS